MRRSFYLVVKPVVGPVVGPVVRPGTSVLANICLSVLSPGRLVDPTFISKLFVGSKLGLKLGSKRLNLKRFGNILPAFKQPMAQYLIGLLLMPLSVIISGCEVSPDSSATLSPNTVNTAQTDSPSELVIKYPVANVDDSAFIQVAENNLTVVQVQAQDMEGSKLIYRLQNGEDMDKFVMDENTGLLSFKNLPDWEQPQDADSNNNYMVLWQVLSSTGQAKSQFLIVQVTDLPD